jgi:hypothetical protein
LFDIGTEGGEHESDGEMLAETDEIPYECGPRQKYPMLFDEPIPLQVCCLIITLIYLKILFIEALIIKS